MQPKIFIVTGIVLLALGLGTQAGVASQAPEDFFHQQEQTIRAKQAEEESKRRTAEEMVRLEKEKKILAKIELPQERPSFRITEIQLVGAYAEHFDWVQEYLNQYVPGTIGMQGINLLIKKVNEAILDRGYVTTRLYIKEQDISSGRLELQLLAGTVNSIQFADPSTWGTWKNAFPVSRGSLLNIRDIEQGLEQMRRVPSQDIDVDIRPADNPGQSDLMIKVKRTNPARIIASIDDSGTEDTGRLQMSTSLALDNLFSLNDIFNATWNRDAERDGERKGTRATSVYYSLPLGNMTLTFSQSSNSYHQTVAAETPFTYSGKSENLQLTATHLLNRDQLRKTSLEVGAITKKRRSYLDNIEIGVHRQDTTALRLGILHRQYIGSSMLDLAVRRQKGVGGLGAKPGTTDHLPDQPTTRYAMYQMDLNLYTPLMLGTAKGQYHLAVRGQRTGDRIYGAEFFSIGGRYTVRGFDGEQSLSAENGMTIRNEISLPLHRTHQIYTAVDYGRVHGEATKQLLGKELLGMALGFRGQVKTWQYDAFVGWPLKKPAGFITGKRSCGFQLTTQF